MKEKDFSKEILEKYFDTKRILKIILKNHSVITGILVGFFHGDEASDEPSINKWHFVNEKDIEKYNIAFDKTEFGKIINQKDIQSVEFK